jgi:hypothetical protein
VWWCGRLGAIAEELDPGVGRAAKQLWRGGFSRSGFAGKGHLHVEQARYLGYLQRCE